MNYAVNVEHGTTEYIKITPRKRSTKFSLLYVEQGLVLIRLGKMEYAVEAGQPWWLPYDCLTSLTYLPNTRYIRIDMSVRLRQSFPHQAGLVALSPLAQQALLRLSTTERDKPLFDALSTIMKYEACAFQPQLAESRLTVAISQWQPDSENVQSVPDQVLNNDLQLALRVREGYKLEQSGQKAAAIAERLFQGNVSQYQQLKQLLIAG